MMTIPPFQRSYPPTPAASGFVLWFPFQQGKLVVQEHEQGVALIERDAADLAVFDPDPVLNLGTLKGKACLACEIHAERALPAGWQAVDPRTLFGQLDDLSYSLVGYASNLLSWQRHHHYCPNCGQLTEALPASWARTCAHCGFTNYPTVTPAILVLVHDGGDKALLVRKPGWRKHRSIIAGFVEPGESLEGCVRREIYEEVGLQVTDVTYVGSQPWPYPDQLMAGFTARYVAGEIRLQADELEAADWYEHDDLPGLPMQESLSYQIITRWAQSRQKMHK